MHAKLSSVCRTSAPQSSGGRAVGRAVGLGLTRQWYVAAVHDPPEEMVLVLKDVRLPVVLVEQAQDNVQSRYIVPMAARVPVQGFLVKATASTLSPNGGDAVGNQGTSHPRQHQTTSHLGRVEKKQHGGVNHALEEEVLARCPQELKHAQVCEGRCRLRLGGPGRGQPLAQCPAHHSAGVRCARQLVVWLHPQHATRLANQLLNYDWPVSVNFEVAHVRWVEVKVECAQGAVTRVTHALCREQLSRAEIQGIDNHRMVREVRLAGLKEARQPAQLVNTHGSAYNWWQRTTLVCQEGSWGGTPL